MHELSIATHLVGIALEHLEGQPNLRVKTLRIRLGRLTCVRRESLEFCFAMAAENTVLEGAGLEVLEIPLVVHCSRCNCESELPSIQSLRCPRCETPCGDIRYGNELELESIEVIETSPQK